MSKETAITPCSLAKMMVVVACVVFCMILSYVGKWLGVNNPNNRWAEREREKKERENMHLHIGIGSICSCTFVRKRPRKKIHFAWNSQLDNMSRCIISYRLVRRKKHYSRGERTGPFRLRFLLLALFPFCTRPAEAMVTNKRSIT